MVRKLDNSRKFGSPHISILYPGYSLGIGDSGIGSIGRIDQADIEGGTTIKMHPHSNDEILSYFRVGSVIHSDSSGVRETIGRNKLMLMKAGREFFYEERIMERLEGLQIFVRPRFANESPEVLFYDLSESDSVGTWRILGAIGNSTPLVFSSETEIYDMLIDERQPYRLPVSEIPNAMYLLYVFQGTALVNGYLVLSKGESVLTDESSLQVSGLERSEIVLFVTNPNQDCYKEGMFSGNKF